jgi:hypothetical protein
LYSFEFSRRKGHIARAQGKFATILSQSERTITLATDK